MSDKNILEELQEAKPNLEHNLKGLVERPKAKRVPVLKADGSKRVLDTDGRRQEGRR